MGCAARYSKQTSCVVRFIAFVFIVNVTFYNITETVSDVRWVPNSHYSGIYGLLKLTFPKLIPLNATRKILVLDTDLTFNSNIYELWQLFKCFNYKQVRNETKAIALTNAVGCRYSREPKRLLSE